VEVYPDGVLVHEYVFPDTAVVPMVAELPAQTEVLVPALAAGLAFTVIVTEFVLLQPDDTDSTNVYVVVTVGLTVGFDKEEVNPDGLLVHEYVLPVTAVPPIVNELPEQIVFAGPVTADGIGLTVTVTEFEFTQPFEFVSVTVYTVVTLGLTDGLADVEVNPAGLLTHE
jgi:hypothetical protein